MGQVGQNGFLAVGRSKAKVYMEKDVHVRFADVAGVDEAVDELREIVDFLQDARALQALGGRIPKGVLLVGPPGTGKTLLARAVAGEAGCRSSRSPARTSSRCSSASARRACATCSSRRKQKAPCIIFIDELDAIGKARGVGHGRRPRRARADAQPAARRDGRLRCAQGRDRSWPPPTGRRSSTRRCCAPGRFDRQVLVDRPDVGGREADPGCTRKRSSSAADVDLRARRRA